VLVATVAAPAALAATLPASPAQAATTSAVRGRRHPPRRLPSGNLLHSTDGTNFTRLGPAFTMGDTWQFFMGCRFALTNCATRTLGDSVRIARFALTTPRARQRPSPCI
jgi:hypothetical protein